MASSKPADFRFDRGLIRQNILKLQPYRCARDDYSAGILLDANENALGPSLSSEPSSSKSKPNGVNGHSAASTIEDDIDDYASLELNRYPDPVQGEIKDAIAGYRSFKHGRAGTFLGVGSDEIIDLLIRITCTPGQEQGDKLLVCPPTYGMYSVCAAVNDVEVIKCNLNLEPGNDQFQPRLDAIFDILSGPNANRIKLLFLTSPGNPTGSSIPNETVRQILEHPTWRGLVVVDEAYIDFSEVPSAVELFNEGWQNLVVMQTLSKGFGLAGIRLGISFQAPELAQILANTKAPYTIGTPTASLALKALSSTNLKAMADKASRLKHNRTWLVDSLAREFPNSVGPPQGANDANFILVPILERSGSKRPDNARAAAAYKRLAEEKGVVIRFRGNEAGCNACVRITIGSETECQAVIDKLKEVLQEV